MASGLQVNPGKTKAWRINKVANWSVQLKIWVYKEGSLPDKYLGLPLAPGFKQKSVWQDLIDKFDSRLAHWVSNKGRKACAHKIYPCFSSCLQAFNLHGSWLHPWWIKKDYVKFPVGFNTKKKFKFHLILLKKICLPMKYGGSEKPKRQQPVSLMQVALGPRCGGKQAIETFDFW